MKRFRVYFKEGMTALRFVDFVLTEDDAATVLMAILEKDGDIPYFELKNPEGEVYFYVSNIDRIELFVKDEEEK
jgi:hypothetical protein